MAWSEPMFKLTLGWLIFAAIIFGSCFYFNELIVVVEMFVFLALPVFAINRGLSGIKRLADKDQSATKSLQSRVVVLTGASRGIGKETLFRLIEWNPSKIIVGCRNIKAMAMVCQEARMMAKHANSNTEVIGIQLDLSRKSSIHEFVTQLKTHTDKIHVLINNAGIMLAPYNLTEEDDAELHWATNTLGPYRLTKLLLPLLKADGNNQNPNRIINLSSILHIAAVLPCMPPLNIRNIRELCYDVPENQYSRIRAYGLSKLGNIVCTKQLTRELEESGDSDILKCYSVHPGSVASDLQRHFQILIENFFCKIWFSQSWAEWISANLIKLEQLCLQKSLREGADCTLFCASTECENLCDGGHYAEGKEVGTIAESLDMLSPNRFVCDELSHQ